MKIAAKRRFVLGFLAVLLVWPFVHRVLVARHDISPWRFFGFAMYCVPNPRHEVELYTHQDARRLSVTAPQKLIDSYKLRRRTWGRSYRPDRLAARVLPKLDTGNLEVVVDEYRLDRASARIVAERFTYRYAAGEPALSPVATERIGLAKAPH